MESWWELTQTSGVLCYRHSYTSWLGATKHSLRSLFAVLLTTLTGTHNFIHRTHLHHTQESCVRSYIIHSSISTSSENQESCTSAHTSFITPNFTTFQGHVMGLSPHSCYCIPHGFLLTHCCLSRVQLGHSPILLMETLMSHPHDPPPKCQECRVGFTEKRILMDCPHLGNIWAHFFNGWFCLAHFLEGWFYVCALT